MTEDILERAKDLRHYLAHKAEWQDESVIVQELIAEVERLRSFRGRIARILRQSESDCDDLLIVGLDSRIILTKRQDARIKELEAALEDVGDCQSIAYMLGGKKKAEENKILIDYIKRLEAAFLGATKEIVYAIHEGRDAPEGEDVYAEKEAREALERIKNGND